MGGSIMASSINAKNTPIGIALSADSSGQLDLQTVDVTRVSITPNGGVSFGSSGTAYGTLGQVLISNGDAPPAWTTFSGSQWVTSGSNIYYNTGRVAIGTSSPGSATSFTVKAGNSAGTNPGTGVFYKYFGTAASPTESLDWPTPVLCLRGFGDYVQESMLSFGYSNDADYQTGDAVWAFRLDGIAGATTSSASTNLRLGGPGTLNIVAPITSTGNITAYFSDERLKTKLGGIENALEKVQALSGFYYEANDVAQELGYKPKREVGVSAQEVQAVMPEIVSPAPIDDKYLTVDYERLVPLLIEAIKELKAEVDELKKAK